MALILLFKLVAFVSVVLQGGIQSRNAFLFQLELGLLSLQLLVELLLCSDVLVVEDVSLPF